VGCAVNVVRRERGALYDEKAGLPLYDKTVVIYGYEQFLSRFENHDPFNRAVIYYKAGLSTETDEKLGTRMFLELGNSFGAGVLRSVQPGTPETGVGRENVPSPLRGERARSV